jgi:hypothetical protein
VVADENSSDERGLAANAIASQLTGIITSSTVLLVLLGAVAVLTIEHKVTIADVRAHLSNALLWSLLSLVISVYGLSVLPGYVNRYNVAKKSGIAIAAVLSLLCFAFSAGRFWLTITSLL